MNITELVEKFSLKVYSGSEELDKQVSGGYTSDLLSDVMGNATEGSVWITMQTHRNIIAVASLKELAAILLVKNNLPDEDTLMFSIKEKIPLLGTKDDQFTISGKIYKYLSENAVL